MHFLVTGGAGFIGSHVCERLLEEGHTVHALDDLNPFYDPAIKRRNLAEIEAGAGGRFRFLQGDIVDAATADGAMATARFDQVIHIAARAGIRPSIEQPLLYQQVNVGGTANVLEAARKHGVGKIILASSSSVYGLNTKIPFSESDPATTPISPYAASKLACEALGHVYHHVHGMDVAVLRFFTVYGPRQRPDLAISKFARLIRDGKPVPVFGDGSTARDYTYVDDTVDGVVACTRRAFSYEIFNLGESDTVTLTRMIGLLEAALGKSAVIDRQPTQSGDMTLTCADIAKAKARFGYEPRIKVEEGIPRFVEWFRKQPQ